MAIIVRVLGIDSGAKRGGWAVLDSGPIYVASGVLGCIKEPKEAYQEYRMRLTEKWVGRTSDLLDAFDPDVVVTETVPVYGMNDFSQGYLANVMATTVHVISLMRGIDVKQVSAQKVHNQIAYGGKTKKPTKPQVRNGVLILLPELKEQAKSWGKVFEESDALAIALHFLGFSNK